jgi:hypothetical protein
MSFRKEKKHEDNERNIFLANIKLQLLSWIHYMKDDMHHVLLLYHLCAIMKTFSFFSDLHVLRFIICKSTCMQDNQIHDSSLRK